MKDLNANYNERLFSKGIRSRIHYSRFYWLRSSLDRLQCKPNSVLELGCFDAKTINFLPEQPKIYIGIDANFEGGLDIARNKWREKNYQFYESHFPDDIKLNSYFDISICMETFEYILPQHLDSYIEKLFDLTNQYIFITTSNQKGLVFAFKHLAKMLLGYKVSKYTCNEFFNAIWGNMNKVKRESRKGWDYKFLIDRISKYFKIIEVSSYPFRYLPGFGICIIGKKPNT